MESIKEQIEHLNKRKEANEALLATSKFETDKAMYEGRISESSYIIKQLEDFALSLQQSQGSKELSDITDEDAIEVAKIMKPQQSEWAVTRGRDTIHVYGGEETVKIRNWGNIEVNTDGYTFEDGEEMLQSYDFLRSKGYSIPSPYYNQYSMPVGVDWSQLESVLNDIYDKVYAPKPQHPEMAGTYESLKKEQNNLIINYLRTLPQADKDGWVKCSDRMPENDVMVLVRSNGFTRIMERSLSDNKEIVWWCNSEIVYRKHLLPTHWQPLPAPPKQ